VKIHTITLLLVGSILFSGCSMLTAQGRRERAYAHYVAKYSRGRVKQQSVLSKLRAHIPKFEPTQPVVTTELSGPGAVSGAPGGGSL
jgi:hypothetical protein